jgi:predicted NBD/HSP70 family sugar kinase
VSIESRAASRSSVLAELLATSPTTRQRLAQGTGLSTATVTRTIDLLISEGLAQDLHELATPNRGRRALLLEARADSRVAVGVDIGASNTRLLAVDLCARPLARASLPTPPGLSAIGLIDWVADLIREHTGARHQDVVAAGVGLPGAVHPNTGKATNAPHLSCVEDPNFPVNLSDSLGVAVELDNDTNFALLGEHHFGAAQNVQDAAMFTLGTGLGGAVLLGGQLIRGRNGLVGEFGSLPLGPMNSRLEHSLTGPSIMLRAAEIGLRLESPADIFAANARRPLAALRNQYEQSLIVAITAAVVAADPQVIVLGGGIAPSLAASIPAITEALVTNLGRSPEIVLAQLGEYSGAFGATVRALHRVYIDLGVQESELSRLPRRPER